MTVINKDHGRRHLKQIELKLKGLDDKVKEEDYKDATMFKR